MPRGFYPRKDPRAELRRLDALSRERALTEIESIALERLIGRVERKGTRRASYGTNKALARAGLKPGCSDAELLRRAAELSA